MLIVDAGVLADYASRESQFPPSLAVGICTFCWLMCMCIYHGSMRVGRWSLSALMSCRPSKSKGKKGKRK